MIIECNVVQNRKRILVTLSLVLEFLIDVIALRRVVISSISHQFAVAAQRIQTL